MSIGKAKRKFIDQEKHILPGVGSYNVQRSQFDQNRGKSFSRAVRSFTQGNPINISETHHSSFLLRPGPASYSVDLRRTQKIISFTHSKRFFSSNNKIPGPGSYKSEECSKQKIKAGIICRSARRTFYLRQNIPGPGKYDQPDIYMYKKKDPTILFGKAKRNLGFDDLERLNQSRQMLGRTLVESSSQAISNKNKIHYERNWQARKLQKQAKLVKKDEVPNFP